MLQQTELPIASISGSHVDDSNPEHTTPAAMMYRLSLSIYH